MLFASRFEKDEPLTNSLIKYSIFTLHKLVFAARIRLRKCANSVGLKNAS